MFEKLFMKMVRNLGEDEKNELKGILETGSDKVEQDSEVVDISKSEQVSDEGSEKSEKVEDIKDDKKVDEETVDGEVDKLEGDQNQLDEKEGSVQEEINEEEIVEGEPVVSSVEPVGNGLRVEDLVTKDELSERIAAFEAKVLALVKENEDLKNQNTELMDKYENKDFGAFAKKGVVSQDGIKRSREKFSDYAKNFI